MLMRLFVSEAMRRHDGSATYGVPDDNVLHYLTSNGHGLAGQAFLQELFAMTQPGYTGDYIPSIKPSVVGVLDKKGKLSKNSLRVLRNCLLQASERLVVIRNPIVEGLMSWEVEIPRRVSGAARLRWMHQAYEITHTADMEASCYQFDNWMYEFAPSQTFLDYRQWLLIKKGVVTPLSF